MNEAWGTAFAENFEIEAERRGLIIANRKELRPIDYNYTGEKFEENREIFEEIRDTKVRLLILVGFHPAILHIAEALYDVGLRRGDI